LTLWNLVPLNYTKNNKLSKSRSTIIKIYCYFFFIVKDLKFYSYQDAIISCLPTLKFLDDEPLLVERVDGKEVKRANPTKIRKQQSPFKNDLKMIEVGLKSLEVDESIEVEEGGHLDILIHFLH